MGANILLTWILIIAATLLLLWCVRRQSKGAQASVVATVAVMLVWWFAFSEPPAPTNLHGEFASLRPTPNPTGPYIGSDSCLECHQENHRSWSASYHSSMTQLATKESLLANFDDRVVQFAARAPAPTTNAIDNMNQLLSKQGGSRDLWTYHFIEKMGMAWVKFYSHPSLSMYPNTQDGQEFPILLTTGSHHMQAYWFPSARGRTMGMVPLMYLIDDQRWIPQSSALLRPPPASHAIEFGTWNEACVRCHTTGASINFKSSGMIPEFDTEVAELGIACESCHGPARSHVEYRHANPTAPATSADPIVQPARLSHQRSSQVCGGCHSVNDMPDHPNNWQPFAPGTDLESSRHVFGRDGKTRSWLETHRNASTPEQLESQLDSWFWKDGMVRVSGREYNGLRDSKCFTTGEMSCLSCHRMHKPADDPRDLKTWANDQLKPAMQGDQACLQCHEAKTFAAVAHTHHPAESHGSRCQNCHMPHTTYGLLKNIRSHTITSPTVTETTATGRPNACNLCHLDKSLGWTANHLHDWYGTEKTTLSADQKNISAGVIHALSGDAGQRALMAWHFGWKPAQEASGDEWIAPYLSILMDDSYDAVRYLAGKSLKTLPGYQAAPYDFLNTEEVRRRQSGTLFKAWSATGALPPAERGNVLIKQPGKLQQDLLSRLLKARDTTPVALFE